MKQIPLSGKYGEGKFAIVDDEDYEYLSQFTWRANCYGYAVRSTTLTTLGNKKSVTFQMSREITKVTDYTLKVDHKNRNTLDNRKENLRVCSNAENSRNRVKNNNNNNNNNQKKYKGVYKFYNKWKTSIGFSYKNIYIGLFESEDDAARAYNKAANEYFGEFANLNDIDGWEDFIITKNKDNASSKYRGVYKTKSDNKYSSSIYINGKLNYIGRFYDEKVAAVYYNIKAIELHGDKAKLNDIRSRN